MSCVSLLDDKANVHLRVCLVLWSPFLENLAHCNSQHLSLGFNSLLGNRLSNLFFFFFFFSLAFNGFPRSHSNTKKQIFLGVSA